MKGLALFSESMIYFCSVNFCCQDNLILCKMHDASFVATSLITNQQFNSGINNRAWIHIEQV